MSDVKFLTADDFCRDTECELGDDGKIRRCLVGHFRIQLPKSHRQWKTIDAAILEAAFELGAVSEPVPVQKNIIADTNNCRANSLELLARVWNLAMFKMGHVEGNPEAPVEVEPEITEAAELELVEA